jgi:hypothetical protein
MPTVQKIYDSTYIQTIGIIITMKKSSFGNKISQAVSNYYRHVPLLMIWRQGTSLERATHWGFPFK